MSWLEEHIEGFVKPVLPDFEPYPNDTFREGYFANEELTVIKNTWRSIKRAAEGKPVLLPGRDVFIFEILAQREKYPTLFLPECSRLTVRHMKIPDLDQYFLFDTGFAGSIPRGLGVAPPNFKMLSFGQNIFNNNSGIQVFPRLSFSRGLALKIETTPKYWLTGRMIDQVGPGETFLDDGFMKKEQVIRQDLARPEEFRQAAFLTVEIYKNSAPKFVKQHRPMKGGSIW